MVFKPAKAQGLLMGLIFGVVFFGTVILGGHYSLVDEPALKWLILVPAYLLLVGYLYILAGLISMKYVISKDGIEIVWINKRYAAGWDEVSEIVHVTGRINLVNYLGISWPGYVAGMYNLMGVGATRLFGTDPKELLLFKTPTGNLSLTPTKEMFKAVQEQSGKEMAELDLYDLPDSEIGQVMGEDLPYLGLFALNIITLLCLGLYLAIFFPGSGASPMMILLMVLALYIFAFNTANASRLFNFLYLASYFIWFIGVSINVGFLIMAMSTIGFGM